MRVKITGDSHEYKGFVGEVVEVSWPLCPVFHQPTAVVRLDDEQKCPKGELCAVSIYDTEIIESEAVKGGGE